MIADKLSEAQCVAAVAQYLLEQDWQLVSPTELGTQIWARLQGKGLAAAAATQPIQHEVWQLYGAILHARCQQNDDRAWTELIAWLQRQAPRLVSFPPTQVEAVQETVIALQRQLQESPLNASRAFFAFALQVLRRMVVDLQRRRTAVMRGEGKVLSLEEISEGRDIGEEQVAAPQEDGQSVEMHVANKEIRQQLRTFFRHHLPTELQWQVAEAHFLDGLSPMEIAALIGKPAHEILLVKARIVQKLQNLAEPDRQQLAHVTTVSGRIHTESGNLNIDINVHRDRSIRLDTALPSQVKQNRSFELAVAIRQIDSPILQEEELDKTKSGKVQVTWSKDSDSVPLRIHVSAPECAIANDTHSFRLTKGQDSPVFYFQLTPQQTGRIGIVVTVYQEMDWLGGTRLHTIATEQPVGAVTIEIKSYPFNQMALVEEIKHHFSPAELHLLCHDLKIFYYDIRRESYTEEVLELIRYMVRRGRVPELLEQCQKLRPQINWLALADIVPVGEEQNE